VSARRLLRKEERTGFSFGPTARGEDARGDGCMRYAWSGRGDRSTAPARGGGSGRAAVTPVTRRRLSGAWDWQVGPTFFYLLRFSNTHTLIFELVTFLMSKFRQIFHMDSWKHKEQLSFLPQLQIPKGLQVIIFRINSNLNLSWILKGFKPFCKNLINCLKFYSDMIYLNMNLHWLTCIQILEVPL
jgi:hypothetical protein